MMKRPEIWKEGPLVLVFLRHSAKMFVKSVNAMARGHVMGIPKGDVRQLPGVFIIDTASRLRFSHHASAPADHPQPEGLLAVLRDL